MDSSLSTVQQSIAPGLGGIGTNSLEKSFRSLPGGFDLSSPSTSSIVLVAANGEGTTHDDVRSRERLLLFSPPAPMLLRRPPGLFAGLSTALQAYTSNLHVDKFSKLLDQTKCT